MSKKLQLHIPTPCHENWEKMTAVEKGRFCGSCQKQVVDFTNMSDREVAMFFKKPSTGSVCGRFMQDQLGRDIEIPKKRIPWLKYFFQFVLPAFLVSAKATAQGKVRVKEKEICTPVKRQTAPMIIKDTIGDTVVMNSERRVIEVLSGIVGMISEVPNSFPVKIKGSILDSNTEQPIPYATIRLINAQHATCSDKEGKFNFKAKSTSDKSQIEISSVGYETQIIDYTESKGEVIIKLKQEAGILGEVVVTTATGIVKGKVTMGAYSIVKMQTVFDNELNQTSADKDLVHLYPNPIKSGSSLNIEWRKNETGDYKLELFNLSGQLIFSKEIWIDEEARLLNIQIPQVAAGNYLLRMTNKTSGKGYTEKLIIQ